MINKNNLPIIFLGIGMVVSLILALVGGFFGNAYFGTLGVGVTLTIVVLWYLVLAIGHAFSKKKNASKQDVDYSSIDTDDW